MKHWTKVRHCPDNCPGYVECRVDFGEEDYLIDCEVAIYAETCSLATVKIELLEHPLPEVPF